MAAGSAYDPRDRATDARWSIVLRFAWFVLQLERGVASAAAGRPGVEKGVGGFLCREKESRRGVPNP